jgi:hypothetical protein
MYQYGLRGIGLTLKSRLETEVTSHFKLASYGHGYCVPSLDGSCQPVVWPVYSGSDIGGPKSRYHQGHSKDEAKIAGTAPLRSGPEKPYLESWIESGITA